jgi:ADP-heptose:LPS heptosyltransferase
MKNVSNHFLTILFGPIGDTLMALALFDDILSIDSNATLVILTRRNLNLINELALGYTQVSVLRIPSGMKAVPFFARLLMRRWTFLTLGVTGAYSTRLKLFLFTLTHIPGNLTVGFNDQAPGFKKWLPLHEVLQFDGSRLIINNFRDLLIHVYGPDTTKVLYQLPPRVRLQKVLVSNAKPPYVVLHMYGDSIASSFPQARWITLVKAIRSSFPQMQIVITGTELQRKKMGEVAQTSSGISVFIDFPLLSVVALIENAELYIGIDTGITHLAGVLQKKSLIIGHFGDLTWIPTYNSNARVLVNSSNCTCGTNKCCVVIDGETKYRRCSYDISDTAILDSIHLALSSSEQHLDSFVGLIDERSA